jgi:hypothetical protein
MTLVKTIVKGSTGTKEIFQIKQFDSTGKRVPLDLTGFTVKIVIYDTNRITKKVDYAPCDIEGLAIDGVVSFTKTSQSSDTAGRYLGRLYYTNGTQKDYTREFQWNVEEVVLPA